MTANGLPFLVYFFLECGLSVYWFKKLNVYHSLSTNKWTDIGCTVWNRCFLILIPVMAGIDNLRYFSGSILSEQQCKSQSSQNLLHAVSFMHLVLLPFIILSCYIFAISPRTEGIKQPHNATYQATATDIVTDNAPSVTCSIGWILSCSLSFIFFVNGMYSFIVSRPYLVYKTTFDIHHWGSDHEWVKTANIMIGIGFQIPVVVSLSTLIMNGVLWYKYLYYIPFIITCVSAGCMGTFASSWADGFFFTANLFEWTLFVQYFLVDQFLFYQDLKLLQTVVGQTPEPIL
eukprot:18862_1